MTRLLFGAVSLPLDRAMHVGSLLPVVATGLIGGAATMSSTVRGVVQGRGDFGLLSLSVVAGPLVRISTLLVLLVAGLRFTAGLAAYVAAGVASYTAAKTLAHARRPRVGAVDVGSGD